MKLIIIFSLVALAVCSEKLSTDNNRTNIEAVVSNPDTLKAFYECFVDMAPCDFVAADLRNDLSDVFKTACSKCTSAQKYILRRFLEETKKFPEKLEELKKKYDPKSAYFSNLEKAIAKV